MKNLIKGLKKSGTYSITMLKDAMSFLSLSLSPFRVMFRNGREVLVKEHKHCAERSNLHSSLIAIQNWQWFSYSTSCITIIFLFSITSCFKEKPLAPKKNDSTDKRVVIPMTSSYEDMYYFSLQTGQVVQKTNPAIYDLMFDNNANSLNIWLNGSKLMMAKRTNTTDFEKVKYSDTLSNDGWLLDKPTYQSDSNAIGKWWNENGNVTSRNEVYLIKLGKDILGNPLGYRKIQVVDYSLNTYKIRFAYPDGSDEHTALVTKDNLHCYSYLSFDNGGKLVDAEPAKDTWDLVFTRYSYVFYDPYYLPYIVVGALSNPQTVECYVDSTVSFENTLLPDLKTQNFAATRDVIGYDWKLYDFTEYKALPYRIYFVRTKDQRFYKLRFLDFYNESYERGFPTFEFEEL
jgi:hypothetical protein